MSGLNRCQTLTMIRLMKNNHIIPFATSGGSAITGSAAALKKLYPQINWQTGMLLNHVSENDIKAWCNKMGLVAL